MPTSRSRPRRVGALGAMLALATFASTAPAGTPNGPGLLRALGPRAQSVFEPGHSTLGAVVRVPGAVDLESLGLKPLAPGFARLRGTVDELLAFSTAHPELPLEVAPPPHVLLNNVGRWIHSTEAHALGHMGQGVLIGVADTGVDFTLDDFKDPKTGLTRIAWLLDFTQSCANLYPAIEAEYGDCAHFGGAVYAGIDLDAIEGSGTVPQSGALTDVIGHGTHVASIAAGNGGLEGKYVGVAPEADLVIARITRGLTDDIATDDLLAGVQFLFDRADALRKPIAVNLSIGSDFGSHDGTVAWEEALAANVGPTHPGHALLVAAGNSGDITSGGVHTSINVPAGTTRRVPITCLYPGTGMGQGQVQVWVTMRGGAQMSVGLDSPDGTWVYPVAVNQTGGYPPFDAGLASDQVSAVVDNGSSVSMGQIQSGSNSAIVIWGGGDFAAGTYYVTLTGEGVADLYVEGSGDVLDVNGNGVAFTYPVREGTVNIPATNPGIIAVGCTVNRSMWTSIDNGPVSIGIAPIDPRGGYAVDASTYSTPTNGDVCWFSSAGPTVTGAQKPEISAPGGLVIAAMSGWASPLTDAGLPGDSIFDNAGCPSLVDGGAPDPACMVIDTTHAVAAGTSMSSPQAAGVAALLFQEDPTLTQDKILGLLQAGAHPFRSAIRFEDQGGPGELDAMGALDALSQARDPALALPSLAASWVTVSADELTADGSTPLTVIVELRTVDGIHRADFFDPARLQPLVELDAATLVPPPMQRRAPGVWVYEVTPPPGLGGHTLTVGATFDGTRIVYPKTIPIATDVWTANYPARSMGSCAVSVLRSPATAPVVATAGLLAVFLVRRRRRHSAAAARDSTHPCGSRR